MLTLVKNNGWALRFTPEKHKTLDLCLEAIIKNISGMENNPELIDRIMIEFFKYVPDELKFRIKEICRNLN